MHAPTTNTGMKKKGVLLPVTQVRPGDEMIFGIVDVMEIDVVAEELTAHWMVAEVVMHQRLRK